jgi:hypothetical protein
MMLHISYAPEDAQLANRIESDLKAAGYEVSADPPRGVGHVFIPIVSPAGNASATVQANIIHALDDGQHIIPVLAKRIQPPKLIQHLSGVDYSDDYDFALLRNMVQAATAPDAGRPLKVLTPTVRAANRRIGVWLAALVLLWFIVGIVLVGFFGIQAPREEYNSIDTIVAVTVQAILSDNLPRTTDEAANFPATLEAVPSAQLPFLIGTATTQAERNGFLAP